MLKIIMSPTRKSTLLFSIVCSLLMMGCSLSLEDSLSSNQAARMPAFGTYKAIKWISHPDKAPPGSGFDNLAHGASILLTLNENYTAKAHVSQLNAQGILETRLQLGFWEVLDGKLVVQWDDEDEVTLWLPMLELQVTDDKLKGVGKPPRAMGWADLLFERQ